MKNIKYMLALATVLFLSGCYKDEGNYTYTDKSRIEIGGILDSYKKVSLLDDPNLKIPATITTDYPASELSYVWTIGLQGSGKMDTIGDKKDLEFNIGDAPVSLRPGSYNIVLAVAHKMNAQQAKEHSYTVYKQTSLSVETKFSRGFYILKQTVDGNTDMDFVILEDNFGKLNLVQSPARFEVTDKVSDIFDKTMGGVLLGKPQTLAQLTYHPYIDPVTNKREASNCLGITTDQTMAVVRSRDMMLIGDHQNTFWNPAGAAGKPGRFLRSYAQSMYVSADGYFGFSTGESALGSGRFGPATEIAGKGGSKWMASLHSLYSQLFITWDEVNGRFLMVTSQSNGLTVAKYAGSGNPDLPQPNNINDDMLFMGSRFFAEEDFVYAITQPKNGSNRKLYKLSRNNSRAETPIDWMVSLPSNSKLNNASSYALNTWDANILYYVNQGELYCTALGSIPESATGPDERLNVQGLPAGEQVTYVNNRFWWSQSEPNFKFNYLVVGSSKGDGKYTISMYQTTGGKPQGTPKVQFSGEGNIADIQFMAPQGGGRSDMTMTAFGYDCYGLSY